METLISIFREVRDPRDFNARHDLAAILFIALAATLCGSKSCVDFADFAVAYEDELAEIVNLGHGPPSHDCFSRVFRLLDPEEMAQVFARFVGALREGLGLGPAKGVVAVDGKRLRRGYERGRAFMPPLMVSVWDAETRLSLGTRHAPGGDEVAATLAALKSLVLKGCIVTGDALHCHPGMAAEVRRRGAHYALKLKPTMDRCLPARSGLLRPLIPTGHLPATSKATKTTVGTNVAAPASLRGPPTRPHFPISPPLAGSKPSATPMARLPKRFIMWSCPNGSRPNAC